MSDSAISLRSRRQQWDVFQELIIQPHLEIYPDSALLTMNQPKRTPSRTDIQGTNPMCTHHVPLNDAEAGWNYILSGDEKVVPTYVGIAPRMGHLAGTVRRGRKEELYALPALFADIDVNSGDHASSTNPPREVADHWLSRCPLGRPTMLFWTGGGYHAWWGLPALPLPEQQVILLARTKEWWVREAEYTNHNFDKGVINSTTMLRAPGSIVGKNGDTTPIELVEVN